MPAWLLNLVISLAIKIGIPALVKYLPFIPGEVITIIEKLLNDLSDPKVSNSSAKKSALRNVKRVCSGVGCPSEPV